MVHHHLPIVFLTLTSAFTSAQPDNAVERQAMLLLLPAGEHQADVLTRIVSTPRMEELTEKYKAAKKEDPDFFYQTERNAKKSGIRPAYDERFRMTKEEYDEMNALIEAGSEVELVSNGMETLTIIHAGDKIRFQGTGVLKFMQAISFDISNSTATLGRYELATLGFKAVKDDANFLKSSWAGFQWRYEYFNKDPETLETLADLNGLHHIHCTIVVAKISKTKKTYIHISLLEMEGGQDKRKLMLPFVF